MRILTNVCNFVTSVYHSATGKVAALSALAYLAFSGPASAQPAAVDIADSGIDFGLTAAGFATSVGTIILAVMGFTLMLATVRVFQKWIGAGAKK